MPEEEVVPRSVQNESPEKKIKKAGGEARYFLDRKRTPLVVGGVVLMCIGAALAQGSGLIDRVSRKLGETGQTAQQETINRLITEQLKLAGIDPTKFSAEDTAKIARYTDGFVSDYANAQDHLTPGKGSKENLNDFWATQLAPNEKGGYDDRQIVSGMALITALQQQSLMGKTCDRTALGQNIQKKLGYDPNDINKFLDNEDKFCNFLLGQPGGKSILGAIPASQARTHLAVGNVQEIRRRSNADYKQNAKMFRSVRRS